MPIFPSSEEQLVLEPNCHRCPELVDSRNTISWGTGPMNATLMIVGEAPGNGDPSAAEWRGGNWTGMAYTTRHSGRQIRTMFENLGYSPADCYYTNTVKCCPTTSDGETRAPTAEERATCLHHLHTEITRVDPTVIIPTGRVATETLFSFDDQELDSFLNVVLDPIPSEQLGKTLLPLLHPSYQAVWLSRLGYTRDQYLTEITETLTTLLNP